MQRIIATNGHASNDYTVTTLTTYGQVDLYHGNTYEFPVNDEVYAAVTAELAGFSGVTFFARDATGEREETILDAGSLSGTVNDWAPSGLAGCSVVVVAASLLTTITGMAGGYHGRRVTVINSSGTLINIQFSNQSGSSAAANRFILPGLTGLTLSAGSSASFVYQGGSVNRWRVA